MMNIESNLVKQASGMKSTMYAPSTVGAMRSSFKMQSRLNSVTIAASSTRHGHRHSSAAARLSRLTMVHGRNGSTASSRQPSNMGIRQPSNVLSVKRSNTRMSYRTLSKTNYGNSQVNLTVTQ